MTEYPCNSTYTIFVFDIPRISLEYDRFWGGKCNLVNIIYDVIMIADLYRLLN